MAYSQTDLDNIESAIIDLATGKRAVRVHIDGKIIEYGQAQLNELKSLRADVKAELDAAAGAAGFVLTTTSKGL